MPSFYVHRVLRWPDGDRLVELSEGRDSADPGVLGTKYKHLHEGWELNNPKEAAVCAVRIMRAWEADDPGDEPIFLGLIGLAGELGIPADDVSARELFTWARRRLDAIPKCAYCGDPIEGEEYKVWDSPFDDVYCREFCAEEAHAHMYEETFE